MQPRNQAVAEVNPHNSRLMASGGQQRDSRCFPVYGRIFGWLIRHLQVHSLWLCQAGGQHKKGYKQKVKIDHWRKVDMYAALFPGRLNECHISVFINKTV